MKKSNFSPIQNFRKHKETVGFLNHQGVILALTKLENPNPRQYYSGYIGLIKLENGHTLSCPIHTSDIDNAKVNAIVKLSLRLESISLDGLRNYNLVAKIVSE